MDILFAASLAALISSSNSTAWNQRHAPSSAAMARERQWLYREVPGSGQPTPIAVFLSYDYSEVVFTATCDRRTRELVVRSKIEVGPDDPLIDALQIFSLKATVRLQTKLVDGYLEGRIKVSSTLASILRSDSDLQVFVPTEMGEPLYVGRAEPLRRLGLRCMK